MGLPYQEKRFWSHLKIQSLNWAIADAIVPAVGDMDTIVRVHGAPGHGAVYVGAALVSDTLVCEREVTRSPAICGAVCVREFHAINEKGGENYLPTIYRIECIHIILQSSYHEI